MGKCYASCSHPSSRSRRSRARGRAEPRGRGARADLVADLDGGIETPAEKLAQTLLPSAVRGRIAGFLDGTAKRAGAVLGGVIAAILVGAPTTFYAVMAIAGAVWLVAAARIARELPVLAIAAPLEGCAVIRNMPGSQDDADALASSTRRDRRVVKSSVAASRRDAEIRARCPSAAERRLPPLVAPHRAAGPPRCGAGSALSSWRGRDHGPA